MRRERAVGGLQWARAQGCPWNEYTCEYAASGGHLAVLQWARAQGCPWDKGECEWYATIGDENLRTKHAVLQWIESEHRRETDQYEEWLDETWIESQHRSGEWSDEFSDEVSDEVSDETSEEFSDEISDEFSFFFQTLRV